MACSRCDNDELPGQRYCRSCRNQYDIERYRKRRDKWIAEHGGQCVKCGSVDDLQFDHIDPKTKQYAITKLWTKPELTISLELSKCQLLCRTCHIVKTKQDRTGSVV